MQMALMTDCFLGVRQGGLISFYQFVSLLSTILSSSSGRSEQIIKIRRPANLKRHYGISSPADCVLIREPVVAPSRPRPRPVCTLSVSRTWR
jgi:hypothetical protein